MELCLFDQPDGPERTRVPLRERRDHVWHVFLPDARPGQLYAYRVHGPYEPAAGHRFNPNKILLDPYARALGGQLRWSDEMFGYTIGHAEEDLSFDERDNAPFAPKGVVIDPAFRWTDHQRPNRPLHESIIYEVHVKGFSKLWEELPEQQRGTYAGLASPEAIRTFKRLGITAVELLPVHAHADGRHLVDRGLSDYWGYNTLGFFAPEPRYASNPDDAVREFKTMVNRLHHAGLEVFLDVVYNHTCEGNHLGPTLSFRGIDNAVYYHLTADSGRYYMDYTGTGNTLNVPEPRVLQLVMDSLRYWAVEMHVDGFRFDLASALARDPHEVNMRSAFMSAIQQDPVLSRVKLIAEPWDTGMGGYHVGNFPAPWSEWNGRYRDTIRRTWKGEPGMRGELAQRLCGSADLYEWNNKSPAASVNFVTAHDGYSLQDLVSFEGRHNEANGEDNRDGEENNNSCNWGHEGLDATPHIRWRRRRLMRSLLATLFASQGAVMLRAGDEFGATQQGNNNAYCQDNEISWLTWQRDRRQNRLFRFVSHLARYRQAHPLLRRARYFRGQDANGNGVKDVTWFDANGSEMNEAAWAEGHAKVLGVMLSGESANLRDEREEPLRDVTLLLFFNPTSADVEAVLPGPTNTSWVPVIDTAHEQGFLAKSTPVSAGSPYRLRRHVFVLFEQAGSKPDAEPSPRENSEPGHRSESENRPGAAVAAERQASAEH